MRAFSTLLCGCSAPKEIGARLGLRDLCRRDRRRQVGQSATGAWTARCRRCPGGRSRQGARCGGVWQRRWAGGAGPQRLGSGAGGAGTGPGGRVGHPLPLDGRESGPGAVVLGLRCWRCPGGRGCAVLRWLAASRLSRLTIGLRETEPGEFLQQIVRFTRQPPRTRFCTRRWRNPSPSPCCAVLWCGSYPQSGAPVSYISPIAFGHRPVGRGERLE